MLTVFTLIVVTALLSACQMFPGSATAPKCADRCVDGGQGQWVVISYHPVDGEGNVHNEVTYEKKFKYQYEALASGTSFTLYEDPKPKEQDQTKLKATPATDFIKAAAKWSSIELKIVDRGDGYYLRVTWPQAMDSVIVSVKAQ